MNYFAYGSNMSLARLRQRVPSVQRLGTALLRHHDLRFHKQGRDGSGKCDAFFTGRLSDAIHGVLYHIEPEGKAVLDRIEGLGAGYDEKRIELVHEGGALEAVTYVATHIGNDLQPFEWYLEHVLVGAREAQLPGHYVDELARTAAASDPDPLRHHREMAIHR